MKLQLWMKMNLISSLIRLDFASLWLRSKQTLIDLLIDWLIDWFVCRACTACGMYRPRLSLCTCYPPQVSLLVVASPTVRAISWSVALMRDHCIYGTWERTHLFIKTGKLCLDIHYYTVRWVNKIFKWSRYWWWMLVLFIIIKKKSDMTDQSLVILLWLL